MLATDDLQLPVSLRFGNLLFPHREDVFSGEEVLDPNELSRLYLFLISLRGVQRWMGCIQPTEDESKSLPWL